MATSHVVGIDLGTTNSSVAIFEHNQVCVIGNEQGNRTTPSMVTYRLNKCELVGDASKARAIDWPQSTVYEAKRILGQCFCQFSMSLTSPQVERTRMC